METEDKAKEPAIKRARYFSKVEALLKGKDRIALFTHAYPDPDALGSMMGMEWLVGKLGGEVSMFVTGMISHPQNRSFVNLLDPDLRDVDDYDPAKFDAVILLDSTPSHAGVGKKEVKFDLVLDHHKDNTNGFKGLVINLKNGSSCGIVYNLIKQYGLDFEDDNDYDARVVTGLLVGIATDTENLMADDATEYEFEAWSQLFPYRDPLFLKQIVNFERPKFWIESESDAVSRAKVEDGIGVVGLGVIPAKHRDMISDMAQNMVSWEDVNTAIAFAVVDGNKIVGCVRTNSASMSVPALCEALGGKYGSGGGKRGGKGAYQYDLAGASIEEDDDEDTKEMTWNLLNHKEIARIFRLIRSK
jgi:nanoRNase/pAp phosphatase (c-di-AMP/oligoRNAs hydrolase)